ncbi:hypothetical protein [Teredinibacter franksiae]|uniref:hypothetical protein n=1 Tax=Teredinibacter franksiae TaxID=2761453 RepID=UPI0016235A93|nr:hypothetical protein [Teredinibacter franksiae]
MNQSNDSKKSYVVVASPLSFKKLGDQYTLTSDTSNIEDDTSYPGIIVAGYDYNGACAKIIPYKQTIYTQHQKRVSSVTTQRLAVHLSGPGIPPAEITAIFRTPDIDKSNERNHDDPNLDFSLINGIVGPKCNVDYQSDTGTSVPIYVSPGSAIIKSSASMKCIPETEKFGGWLGDLLSLGAKCVPHIMTAGMSIIQEIAAGPGEDKKNLIQSTSDENPMINLESAGEGINSIAASIGFTLLEHAHNVTSK